MNSESNRTPRCIIIHIGIEKTGSSAIQLFLDRNRSALLQRGYLVPPRNTTYDILKCLDRQSDLYESLRWLNEYPPNTKLILSDEHFSWLDQCQIKLLKSNLDRFATDEPINYFILVYLRSQADVAISRYSTALRLATYIANGEPEPSVIPHDDFPARQYDYNYLLSQWAEIFGDASLQPKDYSTLFENDVVADFCKVIGIDHACFELPYRQNSSLNANAQSFLKAFNHATQKMRWSSKARDLLNSALDATHSGNGLVPSRLEVESMMLLYERSNQHVNDRWFTGNAKFPKMDLSRFPDHVETRDLSLNDAMIVFAHVIGFVHGLLIESSSQLDEMVSQIAVLRAAVTDSQDHNMALQTALNDSQDHNVALQTALNDSQDHNMALQGALTDSQDHNMALQTALNDSQATTWRSRPLSTIGKPHNVAPQVPPNDSQVYNSTLDASPCESQDRLTYRNQCA